MNYGQCTFIYPDLDDLQIDTLVLGNGSTLVGTMSNPDEGYAGVSFTNSNKPRSVGANYMIDGVLVEPDEEDDYLQKNAHYQIISDNVASFDVLIERLESAKQLLIEMQK